MQLLVQYLPAARTCRTTYVDPLLLPTPCLPSQNACMPMNETRYAPALHLAPPCYFSQGGAPNSRADNGEDEGYGECHFEREDVVVYLWLLRLIFGYVGRAVLVLTEHC